MLDDPNDIKNKFWEITYIGLDDPNKEYRSGCTQNPPIERIPAEVFMLKRIKTQVINDVPTGENVVIVFFFDVEECI